MCGSDSIPESEWMNKYMNGLGNRTLGWNLLFSRLEPIEKRKGESGKKRGGESWGGHSIKIKEFGFHFSLLDLRSTNLIIQLTLLEWSSSIILSLLIWLFSWCLPSTQWEPTNIYLMWIFHSPCSCWIDKKARLGFSVTAYGKIPKTFLANPIKRNLSFILKAISFQRFLSKGVTWSNFHLIKIALTPLWKMHHRGHSGAGTPDRGHQSGPDAQWC